MAATAEQIARLRRLVAEPEADTYDATAMATYIERYPVLDSEGHAFDDEDWTESYDLFAAAADICDEKAADLAAHFDFAADGGTFSRSQEFDHWSRLASRYRSRRQVRSITLIPSRPYVLNEELEEYTEEELAESATSVVDAYTIPVSDEPTP